VDTSIAMILQARHTTKWRTHSAILHQHRQGIGVLNAYKLVLRQEYIACGPTNGAGAHAKVHNHLHLIARSPMPLDATYPAWIIRIVGWTANVYEHRGQDVFDVYASCILSIANKPQVIGSKHDIIGVSCRNIPFQIGYPKTIWS
jgi:hypothetical protein